MGITVLPFLAAAASPGIPPGTKPVYSRNDKWLGIRLDILSFYLYPIGMQVKIFFLMGIANEPVLF
jgi:hypothetical protein